MVKLHVTYTENHKTILLTAATNTSKSQIMKNEVAENMKFKITEIWSCTAFKIQIDYYI